MTVYGENGRWGEFFERIEEENIQYIQYTLYG